MIWVVALIGGLVILVKSADYLVDGSSSFAKRLKIPTLLIGLTVVSFGTTAPEMVVGITSSFQGQSEIALGNTLGTLVANILLVLGISAVIGNLRVQKATVWRAIPLTVFSAVLLLVLASDHILSSGGRANLLGRGDGLVLIGGFFLFLYYAFTVTRKRVELIPHIRTFPIWTSVVMMVGGVIGLALGGALVVRGAVEIATMLRVSETLIGLTIIAMGTSLPELATAIEAVRKGRDEIAVGDIVGANIYNAFLILGVSTVIHPIPIAPADLVNICIAIGASLLLFFAMFVGKKRELDRWQGVAFVSLYVAYIAYLLVVYV